jgi:hypothetical protein
MMIKLSELHSFYINMEKDVSRRHSFLKWNKALDFKNVKRIVGIAKTPYYVGLSHAFKNAIEAGLQRNHPFIIFEDDATPTENFINYVEVPDDADAVYLGVSPWGVSSHNNKTFIKENGAFFLKVDNIKNVFRVKNTLSAHAVLHITKRYSLAMQKVFEESIEQQSHSDVQAYKYGIFEKYKVYAIGPLFYQHDKNKPSVLEGTKNINIENFKNNE